MKRRLATCVYKRMVYTSVLANVGKHISLQEEEATYFSSLLKHEPVGKKDFVLRQGDTCKTINFVDSGILRAYYTNAESKEATIMFAVADWWITDMYCFLNQCPAMLNIQAVEDSSILKLRKADLDKLYRKVPAFERFFRILMQNAYVREQLRMIENLSLPAEVRYNNFLKKYPKVAKQVTQKQIASYLGITPEFLSALRAGKKV